MYHDGKWRPSHLLMGALLGMVAPAAAAVPGFFSPAYPVARPPTPYPGGIYGPWGWRGLILPNPWATAAWPKPYPQPLGWFSPGRYGRAPWHYGADYSGWASEWDSGERYWGPVDESAAFTPWGGTTGAGAVQQRIGEGYGSPTDGSGYAAGNWPVQGDFRPPARNRGVKPSRDMGSRSGAWSATGRQPGEAYGAAGGPMTDAMATPALPNRQGVPQGVATDGREAIQATMTPRPPPASKFATLNGPAEVEHPDTAVSRGGQEVGPVSGVVSAPARAAPGASDLEAVAGNVQEPEAKPALPPSGEVTVEHGGPESLDGAVAPEQPDGGLSDSNAIPERGSAPAVLTLPQGGVEPNEAESPVHSLVPAMPVETGSSVPQVSRDTGVTETEKAISGASPGPVAPSRGETEEPPESEITFAQSVDAETSRLASSRAGGTGEPAPVPPLVSEPVPPPAVNGGGASVATPPAQVQWAVEASVAVAAPSAQVPEGPVTSRPLAGAMTSAGAPIKNRVVVGTDMTDGPTAPPGQARSEDDEVADSPAQFGNREDRLSRTQAVSKSLVRRWMDPLRRLY